MARILVTEEIAEAGLDRLRAAGHEVDFRPGLNGSDMAVGQSEAGSTAVMVLSTDRSVDAAVLDDLAAREGIVSVHGIDLV